jgi:hypothetical protein
MVGKPEKCGKMWENIEKKGRKASQVLENTT